MEISEATFFKILGIVVGLCLGSLTRTCDAKADIVSTGVDVGEGLTYNGDSGHAEVHLRSPHNVGLLAKPPKVGLLARPTTGIPFAWEDNFLSFESSFSQSGPLPRGLGLPTGHRGHPPLGRFGPIL
jgi:hypothetical protein